MWYAYDATHQSVADIPSNEKFKGSATAPGSHKAGKHRQVSRDRGR